MYAIMPKNWWNRSRSKIQQTFHLTSALYSKNIKIQGTIVESQNVDRPKVEHQNKLKHVLSNV